MLNVHSPSYLRHPLAVQSPIHSYIVHESVLKDVCWIPSGIESLFITPFGGVFPLQPEGGEEEGDEDMIQLHVPHGAVRADGEGVLEVRYAVIPDGPFKTLEGYRLCSMTVYLYYDPAQATKPFHLLLPHWSTLHLSPRPTPSKKGSRATPFVFWREDSSEKRMGSWRWMVTPPCLEQPTVWRTPVGTLHRSGRGKRATSCTLRWQSPLTPMSGSG